MRGIEEILKRIEDAFMEMLLESIGVDTNEKNELTRALKYLRNLSNKYNADGLLYKIKFQRVGDSSFLSMLDPLKKVFGSKWNIEIGGYRIYKRNPSSPEIVPISSIGDIIRDKDIVEELLRVYGGGKIKWFEIQLFYIPEAENKIETSILRGEYLIIKIIYGRNDNINIDERLYCLLSSILSKYGGLQTMYQVFQ